MRRTKLWLAGTLLLTALGASMLLATSSQAQPRQERREERREERNYWRHHDGRWSHWDAGDRRWYYTDGSHWYYNDNHGWKLYRFDKRFGREGFERGKYMPPPEGVNVVVPQHQVYVPAP